MTDPDVADGQCICRPVDNIMAMGHAHYCVTNAIAASARLPFDVEQMLIDVAKDPDHQSWRRRRLDFNGDTGMRDCFVEALSSPGVQVHVDCCEDDPCEIVVRVSGRNARGSHWSNLNIILLDPRWSTNAHLSQALAEDIVEHWDRLQAVAAPLAIAA